MDDLIQRYTEAWASRDPDAIVALHTEKTVFHAHIGQEPARGKTAVRQAFADMFAQFPNLDFEPVCLRTGDAFWVVESRMSGTAAETGAEFEVDLVDVISVEDGRVASKDSYLDAVSLQTQLGVVTG
ncbi:nuclear transport factor 2 family protein [Nocardia amamiensis]|uniref:nuclear transport factor 2 family protein n=1 Tax=Nocardia amamiensis TaxID=404578 RepID=UPI0008302E68|nr:nuclear transport factor 2 family protein [Nocardia amamiensis]